MNTPYQFFHVWAYHWHMRRKYESGNHMKLASGHESLEEYYFSLSYDGPPL